MDRLLKTTLKKISIKDRHISNKGEQTPLNDKHSRKNG